ncbi:hypothetical protein OCAR_6289 [Afipia carboxidovorans OM5]|nr:hypothetical protein OCAR_6289 [Afipia carboxidovorans OM5]
MNISRGVVGIYERSNRKFEESTTKTRDFADVMRGVRYSR